MHLRSVQMYLTMSIHVGSCVFVPVCTYYCVTEYITYTRSTYVRTYLAVLAVVVVVHNVPQSH